MQTGPDWLSPEEQKLLDAIVETTLDFDTEQRHIHEVVTDDEEGI